MSMESLLQQDESRLRSRAGSTPAAPALCRQPKTASADAVCLAGCLHEQLSAGSDARHKGDPLVIRSILQLQQCDPVKLKQLSMYIVDRWFVLDGLDAMRLNTALFYADFTAYRELGACITHAAYNHRGAGPTPSTLTGTARGTLCRDDVVADVALRSPLLSRAEQGIADQVIRQLSPLTTAELLTAAHKELGWQLTVEGESIPYAAAWFSSEPPTMSEIEIGQAIARKYRLWGPVTASRVLPDCEGLAETATDALGSVSLWEEIKHFIEIYVARNPSIGELIPGTRVYRLKIEVHPPLAVYYCIDHLCGCLPILGVFYTI